MKHDINPAFPGSARLRRVVNAAGTMTSLGANRIVPEAVSAMVAVSAHFVEIDVLQARAAEIIARVTGADSGCLTACSAAGVTLSVAACMTGSDLGKIEQLPNVDGMRSDVLLQSGHAINYGAPIEQAIRLSGARVVEIGGATEAQMYQLRAHLRRGDIAAALYVVSHHTAPDGMISLSEWTSACHEHGVPVIADMAGEFNLRVVREPGVDIAVYSAHKFMGGPTAGIVAANGELARAVYLQNRGIGRQMKIGKENICGAMAAMEAWVRRDRSADRERQRRVLSLWAEKLKGVPGVSAKIIGDWTGNPIDRLQLTVFPDEARLYAWEIALRLRAGDPAIFAREQFLEHGRLVLDPCHLLDGEAEMVARRVGEIVNGVGDGGRRISWDEYKMRAGDAADWPHPGAPAKKDE